MAAVSNTLGETGTIGNDEIIFIAEVESADSHRHQRDEWAVIASGYGNIQETCPMNVLYETAESPLFAMKQGVDVCLREEV